ncbi:MAG: hypothetical protein ABH860_04525 [bacterium]
MRHEIKFTKEEKIGKWLELCDFSYRLMASALSKAELARRLKKMREEHVENNRNILRYMGKLK